MEEEGKGKIPRSQKGGVKGGYSRGKVVINATISKRRILVLAALGNSTDFITNSQALDSHERIESSWESDEEKGAWEQGNTDQWEVNRGDGCCEEFLWVYRRFVECPWQACDSQQNRGYSFFRRQQRPTTFAIASQYFLSHNTFILSNFSFPTGQLLINHFFYTWGFYLLLYNKHFLVFFPFPFQSLIFFLYFAG